MTPFPGKAGPPVFARSAAILLSLSMAACGGAPAWTHRGQDAVDEGLVGVGHAHHVTNPVLRASVAENRARAALMTRLAHCTERVMLSYWREQAERSDDDDLQRTVSHDARTFTVRIVRRIRIVDQYEDGENSYRLAQLDREVLRRAFSGLPQMKAEDSARVAAIFDAEWSRCTQATTGLRGTFRKDKPPPPPPEIVDDPAGCWTWHNRCA